jgi:hypothetical protein
MMLNDLLAACVPPVLALALETWNPISDRYLQREAHALAAPRALSTATADLIANNAKGVASISDLTTTIVSFFGGLGVLILSMPNAPLYLYLLLVLGIVVTLISVGIVLANSPFEIGTRLLPRPFKMGGAFLPISLGGTFKIFAWIANLVLIAVACLIFFQVLPNA